jgi:hypothetical protein
MSQAPYSYFKYLIILTLILLNYFTSQNWFKSESFYFLKIYSEEKKLSNKMPITESLSKLIHVAVLLEPFKFLFKKLLELSQKF